MKGEDSGEDDDDTLDPGELNRPIQFAAIY